MKNNPAIQIDNYLKCLFKFGDAKLLTKKEHPVKNEQLIDAKVKFSINKQMVVYGLCVKKHLSNMNMYALGHLIGDKNKDDKWKLLLAAPYIRRSQADLLEKNGIDYFDLAGNIHLNAPGIFVHVEGKRPEKTMMAHRGRMLQRAGLQVLFILLTQKDAVTKTLRQLALDSSVVHGSVAPVLQDLREQGFIMGSGVHSQLVRREELVALWVNGYINTLRPKLFISKYRIGLGDFEAALQKLTMLYPSQPWRLALSGSQAAYAMQGFYKDNNIVIFTDDYEDELREILFRDHLKLYPASDGNVTQLRFFSNAMQHNILANDKLGQIHLTHPLVTYAELLCDGTERAKEAANMFYEKYLKDSEDEDK